MQSTVLGRRPVCRRADAAGRCLSYVCIPTETPLYTPEASQHAGELDAGRAIEDWATHR